VGALDGWLEGFIQGPASIWVILLVSALLGLRHASDPDHLAAVTTLIASEKDHEKLRKAGIMGVVLVGGEVRPGDPIRVTLPPEPHRPLERV